MNTNDPDYEHVYSIEALDDPSDELLYFPPADNRTDGVPDKQDAGKPVKVKANNAPKDVKVGGKEGAKTTAPKSAKPQPVRAKRETLGEAAVERCFLPMEEGGCERYTMRWYFNGRVRACRPFIYSGCGGNDNRFLHLEECEVVCLDNDEGSPSKQTGR
ncbi:tissue factor pathway inhibitor [Nerophis ophidion]|uniref:tissue factor pathway inhibitor n=1 Tax=Nerophis ophidion TaxID=159077 RepID=UPI002ADFFE17|nr:tissue factor pathway inhibitor [Nerophis ophidion]